MVTVVAFVKNDFIDGVSFCVGDIASFSDKIAQNLINKKYAILHNDGRPQQADFRIPHAKDFWDAQTLDAHVAELRKGGKWAPHAPIELVSAKAQAVAAAEPFA